MSDDAHPGRRQQQDREPPKMLPEAQAENLRAAWEHYASPKSFTPGQIVKGHSIPNAFIDHPLVLFVRKLDPANVNDNAIVADAINKQHVNKIDCIVMLLKPGPKALFHTCDSDVLEPYAP